MTRAALVLACVLMAGLAQAQTDIALGGLNADPTLPVEVTADGLWVDQATGEAVFEGNVVIGQGDLRIAAARVAVTYDETTGDIVLLTAEGQVTFVTATEAAEAQRATYDLRAGTLVLDGDVLLSQGASALSADQMVINLSAGTAQLTGRVRTVFRQAGQ